MLRLQPSLTLSYSKSNCLAPYFLVNFVQGNNVLGFPWWLSGKRICLSMQEMRVWSLGGKDPLKREIATHSSILAWRISWTEEPGELQPMGSQRVRRSWVTKQQQQHVELKVSALWSLRIKGGRATPSWTIKYKLKVSGRSSLCS